MNMGDWLRDMLGELPTGATIVQVICAFNKTHLTNLWGDQDAWPLYRTIGNIHTDNCRIPNRAPAFSLG